MRHASEEARLYLDEDDVGAVHIHGWDGPWGFGDFRPNHAFSEFATTFGRWSLLMHADEHDPRRSRDAADELREAETAIDRMHAKLYLPRTDEWRCITELNIDGTLIEWREDPGRPCEAVDSREFDDCVLGIRALERLAS